MNGLKLEGNEIVVFIDKDCNALNVTEKQMASIKGAFKEYYRGLFLILNFAELNKEGFEKTMKKFDKVLKTEHKDVFMDKVHNKDFCSHKQISTLTHETGNRYFFNKYIYLTIKYNNIYNNKIENVFCRAFFDNDRKGMKSLRLPWEKRSLGWSNFRLGFLSGLSLAALFLLIYFIFILGNAFTLFAYYY